MLELYSEIEVKFAEISRQRNTIIGNHYRKDDEMDNEMQIRKILGCGTQSKSVIASAIFDVLEKASSDEEKIKLLGIAFVERDSVPKQPMIFEQSDVFGNERWEMLNKKLLATAHAFVKATYFSTSSINEFSREILRFIAFFQEKDEKIFVLASILYYGEVMPYKQLPATPLSISQRDYEHLIKSNRESYEMIIHAACLPFQTYAEELSIVLQVIDECGDNRPLKVALLCAYVTTVKRQVQEQERQSE